MNEINPKISTENKIPSIEPENKKKKSLTNNPGAFDKILTNQIEEDRNSTPIKNSTRLPEIESSFKAQQLNLSLNQAQISKQLESSLSLLEKYASWLGNPDKTLKQAYDLLTEALARTESLDQEFRKHTNVDTDLKHILNQLMTTLEVEKVKFNRGDYSD